MRGGLAQQRLVAVFLVGAVLFNYPVLALFDRAEPFFGLPLLHAYVFAVWTAMIGAIAWIVERKAH
jgi:hypothetical protein